MRAFKNITVSNEAPQPSWVLKLIALLIVLGLLVGPALAAGKSEGKPVFLNVEPAPATFQPALYFVDPFKASTDAGFHI